MATHNWNAGATDNLSSWSMVRNVKPLTESQIEKDTLNYDKIMRDYHCYLINLYKSGKLENPILIAEVKSGFKPAEKKNKKQQKNK